MATGPRFFLMFSNGRGSSENISPDIKTIALVGDEGCGKTSLIRALFDGNMPQTTAHLISKEYPAEFDISGWKVESSILDVPAKEEYAAVRPDSYPRCYAVGICFAIDNPASLNSVTSLWMNEARTCVPGDPRIVLVGLKRDLRQDPDTIARLAQENLAPVSIAEALAVKADLEMFAYVECSAKTKEGVEEVFRTCLISEAQHEQHQYE